MIRKTFLSRLPGLLFGSVAALGLALSPQAKAVDFSGERIRIIVPFNEGGGTDSLTRFMQPFFEKYLPGNPKILVVNKPGAGGIVGGNYFEKRAKTDGTWLFALSTSTVMNYTLQDPRVQFDIKNWNPIMLLPRGNMIYVRKELGIQNIDGLKAKIDHLKTFDKEKLVFGGKTPSSSAINKRIALSALGIEVKNVWGMKGNGPMAIAFERGEFTVNFDNSLSYLNNREHLRDQGLAVEFFTLGAPDATGKWGRDPVWPDTPTIYEYYKAVHGKDLSGPMATALEALVALGVGANKSFHLPKGASKDVIEAWREAARQAVKDPAFLEKKEKILGPYEGAIGEPARKLIHEQLRLPEEAKAYIRKYMKQRYDLNVM